MISLESITKLYPTGHAAIEDLSLVIEAGESFGLEVLEDDRHFFPPYDAVPVVRGDTLSRRPVLRALKRDYGDWIVFNGAIDSHHVLIEGTPELVRRQTREVLEIMMPGGGLASASSSTSIQSTYSNLTAARFVTYKTRLTTLRRATCVRRSS